MTAWSSTWRLAIFSAWSRRLTLGICVLAMALSSALLLSVQSLRHDARSSFTQSISGVDLVVGPRTGATQLMLYAVFRSGQATHNMSWDSYQRWRQHPSVAWAIPVSLGDSHRGFPVMGTSTDYFQHFRYGAKRSLVLAQGQPFDGLLEVVLGSEVARALNYKLGQRITITHGSDERGPSHEDKPFMVVGILAPTGTPVDRTLHVSLASMSAIHLDWAGGVPTPGLSIPADQLKFFDLQPKDITAMLIGLHHRTQVFRLQREINQDPQEALMAVMPGVALDELWRSLSAMERVLTAISALVVAIGLSGLVATLLAGLNERRRELVVLRSLGAGPLRLLSILALEGVLVTSVGLLLGVGLSWLGGWALAPVAQSEWGIILTPSLPGMDELSMLSLIWVTGVLVSLLPSWRVWHQSLADGLTPRQ